MIIQMLTVVAEEVVIKISKLNFNKYRKDGN